MRSFHRFSVLTAVISTIVVAVPTIATAQPPGLKARVEALEAQVAELQASVDALESSPLGELVGFVFLDDSDPLHPKVIFEGVNVQIVDGTGSTITDPSTGLGNLIVGYDETSFTEVCSEGPELLEADCVGAGKTWAANQKSGNHNLIVGPRHNYTRSGGVVLGLNNAVVADSSTVTAGMSNVAAGTVTSVHGGNDNSAAQNFSAVSGGFLNTIPFTSGNGAGVISGGSFNTLLSGEATLSGGSGCTMPGTTDLGWGARTSSGTQLGDCAP